MITLSFTKRELNSNKTDRLVQWTLAWISAVLTLEPRATISRLFKSVRLASIVSSHKTKQKKNVWPVLRLTVNPLTALSIESIYVESKMLRGEANDDPQLGDDA